MQYISTTDARADFAAVIAAAQQEPVVIQRQRKDVAVMISPEDYAKLRKVNGAKFDDVCRRASEYAKQMGLTEEKLAELLADES